MDILKFKWTVQRDFRPPVFLINQTHLDPWLTDWLVDSLQYMYEWAEEYL